MLPCTNKSKLIHNLKKLVNTEEQRETPAANEQDDDRDPVSSSATLSTIPKIAIVDGMVLVHKMTK